MINQQTVQPASRTGILNPLIRWLEPRSLSRDEAFRERTVRVTAGILIIATALSLVVSVTVFHNTTWTLLSFPSMLSAILALCVASAIAVSQGRVTLAGWLLVTATLVGSAGTTQLSGYWGFLVPPLGMLVILLTALVLPRQALFPVAGLVLLVYAVIAVLAFYVTGKVDPESATITPWELIIDNLFMFTVEAFFLRQIRVEFDSRLADMRESIRQTDVARKEADRANNAKSQFLSSMSHELRTPLNAIIGYVEIMIAGMAGVFSDPQTNMLQSIHANGKRLLAMINDVLDLSKIEAGAIELKLTSNSPRKLIDDVVFGMQSLAQKKNITLVAHSADDTPEVLLCDATKVQQIVTNLIGNAVKFTAQGSVDVAIGRGKSSATWQIKVTDTGKGMPPDAATYIFDAFRQVDGSDTREFQGSGLGLSITKRLVDRMGGDIKVESTLDKGSTFIVTLPVITQEAPASSVSVTPDKSVTPLRAKTAQSIE